MSAHQSIEDALAHADTADTLRLSCKGLTAIPDAVGELTNLRVLRLDDVPAELGIPDSLRQMAHLVKLDVTAEEPGMPFPTGLFETSVTELAIRHYRIREVFPFKDQVKRLRLASYTIFDDMEPLFTHFTGLEYLEIWGYHARNTAGNKQALVFGPEIGLLTKLEELEVVSAGMTDLPTEMANLKNLKTIRLRKHGFGRFPEALTTIPNLESLEFGHMSDLTSFPPAIANMKALRTLNLSGSWNGGALPSSWEEETYLPLPAVLGELSNLEALNVDQCAVESLDVIAHLTNLRELSLEWATVTDLEPIAALQKLEKLKLAHAWVKDLKPLATLKELRELNISRTDINNLKPLAKSTKLEVLDISGSKLDRKRPLKTLEALIDLPALDTVISDEMEDGAWEKLRGSKPIDPAGLIAQLASDDFAEVMGALNQIIEYSDERSTNDHNALIDLFELEVDDYDSELIEFEPLDQALDRWGSEVNPMDLGRLVRATFVNTSDGWNATIKAIELLIASKNVDAQMSVVEAWSRATAYYDGGHRAWEDSVHDNMIDDLWIQFQPQVLAAFLPTLDGDQLDSEYGDGLDALFVPAFKGLQEPDEDLLECLREYATDREDTPEILELIQECIEVASEPLAAALRDIEQALGDQGSEPSEASESSEASQPNASDTDLGPQPTLTVDALTAAFEASGPDALIDLLGRTHADLGASVCDYAAAYTHNTFIECLKANENDSALELMKAYEGFVAQTMMPSATRRSQLTTNAIILMVRTSDPELERFVLEDLAPPYIADATLAFNLACFWAAKGVKDKVLELTNTARELGKPSEKFGTDTDFEAFWQDPDFREAAGLEPLGDDDAAVRRFEYHDEKSHKFWAVAVEGSNLLLNWGRVGSDGQQKTKPFADPEAAAKECAKLIKQKTGKGYKEV